ncbi:MAG: dihydrofolate reductase [Paludibacteraceae bacterium]|nr:dihydrofolate reductase [Paludibacteraceae bacterium]
MKKVFFICAAIALIATCCKKKNVEQQVNEQEFQYSVEKFADLEILRYHVPEFDSLNLQQKKLVYFLTEAALQGRDILYDENCRYNLRIRHLLESIYTFDGTDRNSDDFKAMEVYLKRVWFSNGIHHHYAGDKFVPGFSREWFHKQITNLDLHADTTALNEIEEVIFNPDVLPKRVNQADGEDLLLTSACNYYEEGITQAEATKFYDDMADPNDETPIMYGLNSRLEKHDGQLVENVAKIDGLYGKTLKRIVFWLEKAKDVAENEEQKAVIEKLIEYYTTGNLRTFDEYSILWVKDLNSRVDFINGFIETYGDPLGKKASWESLVNFKDLASTRRTEIISSNAQWFEDNSPVAPEFKKPEVKGVTAKVITAAILAGDCYPYTPIGINLPNSDWIRHLHGSKSVTIQNITDAYDKAAEGNGFAEEFMWSQEEIEWGKKWGNITDNIHTDLHDCLGHASGRTLPGVAQDALKEHHSTLEEARADLFGLYYSADPKLVELGILSDPYAYKAEYYRFMMNGAMTQLCRIEPGNDIEEAHMRNRQLVANWVLEQSKDDHAVEFRQRDGKTFIVVNDYQKLRERFGQLLAEIQRIKSTGDYAAGKALVEKYAVKVNQDLHKEVLERYAKLNIAPYKGFINPVYEPVYEADGKTIKDIKVKYGEGYAEQHLRYSRDYSAE